jgi:hypothetical protein
MNCSPKIKKKCKKCKTCFDKSSLVKIAKAYNSQNKKKIIIDNRSSTSIWNQLRSAMAKDCENEWCWIDQDFVKKLGNKKILKETFIPKMPAEWKKNKYTWLTTTDINAVMKQYEDVYNNFSFFGPVPVDCPNGIHCELSNIDPLKLHKGGLTKIGIIFNLDYHYQSGSHWVALVIDTSSNPYSIDYFDSYGEKPHNLITKFMSQIENKINKGNKTIKIYNDKRHQHGHSECGVYSMNYILQRLKGRSPYELTKRIIKDSVMNEMRKYLYRK